MEICSTKTRLICSANYLGFWYEKGNCRKKINLKKRNDALGVITRLLMSTENQVKNMLPSFL